METRAEIERIRAVYREYDVCRFGQSKWSPGNRGNQAIQLEREWKSRQWLQRAGFHPLASRRILDLGCGDGDQLGAFLEWGAQPQHLFGVDLIPERIRTARRKFPQISFLIGNAEHLPFADSDFDIVAVSTVFSSILDCRMAANIANEINRILAPGGAVLWYDFRRNNPFNPHVRGMSRRQVQDLFPGFRVALETISLLPPLARQLGPLIGRLYGPLSRFPLMRTHLLGLLTRPKAPAMQPSKTAYACNPVL